MAHDQEVWSLLLLVLTGQSLDPQVLSPYDMVVPLLARQFSQLQALRARHVTSQSTPSAVVGARVSTPLSVKAWQQALASHPDQAWVQHLLVGLHEGFRIGLQLNPVCHSTQDTSPLVLAHPALVTGFIESQVSHGYMVGPLPPTACPNVMTSRLAVIPRGHQVLSG